jgi:hypothetical protein
MMARWVMVTITVTVTVTVTVTDNLLKHELQESPRPSPFVPRLLRRPDLERGLVLPAMIPYRLPFGRAGEVL